MWRHPVAVPVTPPSIRSLRLRGGLAGVLLVAIAAAALGCSASPAATTSAPSEAPSETPTPSPPGKTLFTLTGKGDTTSDSFAASGESVDVTYAYTCATPSSFTLNFYGTNGSQALPDVLIDDFGDKGGDTTTESLNGAPGPFHLDVVTACEWSVEVVGAP